jgi:hypothetical protein
MPQRRRHQATSEVGILGLSSLAGLAAIAPGGTKVLVSEGNHYTLYVCYYDARSCALSRRLIVGMAIPGVETLYVFSPGFIIKGLGEAPSEPGCRLRSQPNAVISSNR